MPLVLVTDTPIGIARWEDASIIGGGGDSLALILEVDPGGIIPAIDPAGRSNIFYIPTDVGEINVELPAITPTLTPKWRLASTTTLQVSAAVGDNIVGVTGGLTYVEMIADGTYASMTFVHDGVDTWALFEAGGNSVGPPL